MVKKRIIEKTRYRRFKNNNQLFKAGIIIIIIMGTFFFLWNSFASEKGTVRAISMSTVEDSNWQRNLYRSILKQAIPGMGEGIEREANREEGNKTEVSSYGNSQNLINSTLYALTSIDPDNPKTFLNAQISTMQQVSFITEGSLNKESLREETSVEQAEQEEDETVRLSNQEAQEAEGEEDKSNTSNTTSTTSTTNTLRPLVIIYHTHTTESFVPTAGKTFTSDLSQTVVRVAEELARCLEEKHDVRVVHNKEIHDIPRSESYTKAAETVKDLVGKYPGADMVIDLHRDGTTREATTTRIKGEDAGRTLMVLGTNHKNWNKNYEIATRIHEKSEELYPGLSRGVRKRSLIYNQDVHPGAVLLEIGGHKNSLEEALRTSRYVADILGEVLKEI